MKKINFKVQRNDVDINDLLTLASFFHGVGGMSKGAANANFQMLYATDFWDVAERAFLHNMEMGVFDNFDFHKLSHVRILDKINQYLGNSMFDVGDIDCVVSGSPCPGQSSVNPFRSNFDIRNSLMVKQIRLAGSEGLRAKTAWFEQVPGFLDKPMRALRMEVLAALESQTDYTYEVRVLNALDFGSYQSRDRVTIIMVRKDVGVPSFPPPVKIDLSKQSVNAVLPHVVAFKYGRFGTPKLATDNVINTMTASGDQLMVFDRKKWRRVSIEERQVLSHLAGYDLSIFKDAERVRLMGNMVQIPFAEAITSHIRSHILIPYYTNLAA